MKKDFSSRLLLSMAAVALIALSLFLAHCSKSSDAAPPSIVGTWKLTSMSITGCVLVANNSAESSCAAVCSTMIINANNTYSTSGGTVGTTSGTWSTGGLPLTQANGAIALNQTSPTISNQVSYQFTLTATKLTFAFDLSSAIAGCSNNSFYARQ